MHHSSSRTSASYPNKHEDFYPVKVLGLRFRPKLADLGNSYIPPCISKIIFKNTIRTDALQDSINPFEKIDKKP